MVNGAGWTDELDNFPPKKKSSEMVGEVSTGSRRMTRSMVKLPNGNSKVKHPGHLKKAKCKEKGDGEIMTTKTGTEPTLLFPEEVWELIIGHVADPTDLWSCSNTCQLFQSILEKWRLRYLLEKALPHFYRHLPKNKLLECRSICKSWKLGMDNFLEDHPSLRPLGSKGDDSGHDLDPRKLDFVNPLKQKEIGTLRNCFDFRDIGNDDILLGDPKFPNMPGGNPFMGRFVVLNGQDNYYRGCGVTETGYPDEDITWTRINELLKTFGKEIWYLNLILPASPVQSEKQRIRQLITVDLFHLVPNLRKLRISDTQQGDAVFPPAGLPPAPKLETIEAEGTCGYECKDPILDAILRRYHTQLRKVYLSMDYWKMGTHLLDWPKLTELHLSFVRGYEDFESLHGGKMPQLRRLGLNLGMVESYKYEDFNFTHLTTAICELLSRYPKLDIIRLEGGLDNVRYRQKRKGDSLTVPASLKTLEVDHYWGDTPSYSFMLDYFPHLENLNIYARRNPHDYEYEAEIDLCTKSEYFEEGGSEADHLKQEETVQINKFAFGGNMYKSNIWEVMPLLKVLTFQWNVYTRGGYEAYFAKRMGAGIVHS